jgi:hypothetical protein
MCDGRRLAAHCGFSKVVPIAAAQFLIKLKTWRPPIRPHGSHEAACCWKRRLHRFNPGNIHIAPSIPTWIIDLRAHLSVLLKLAELLREVVIRHSNRETF